MHVNAMRTCYDLFERNDDVNAMHARICTNMVRHNDGAKGKIPPIWLELRLWICTCITGSKKRFPKSLAPFKGRRIIGLTPTLTTFERKSRLSVVSHDN